MNKNLLLVLIVAAAFAGGCKKESKTNPTATTTADSYFPLTSGSTWRYFVTAAGGNDTLAVKMTGATTNINGRTYYRAINTYQKMGSSTGYFFDAGNVYGSGASSAATGLSVEFQFLNDTATVGRSWLSSPTDDGMVNGVAARTLNTIVEKDIGKTIGGETFTGVIHTRVDLQYNYGSGFQSSTVYDFYFAKGVGMIESVTSISGKVYETETIVSYTINPSLL
jgi:hypothetical protein